MFPFSNSPAPTPITLIGIDLAWNANKNTSGIAIGNLSKNTLINVEVFPSVWGVDAILNIVKQRSDVFGIAIDASLIIPNFSGARNCERQLSAAYGSKNAGCYPTNQKRYPNADSVALSNRLSDMGFVHLGQPHEEPFQLECYPHASLIEIFNLPQRHPYKRGRINDKKSGQVALGHLIASLNRSPILQLHLSEANSYYLAQDHIRSLKGKQIKQNEDALDAIICLYTCALYAIGIPNEVYGTTTDGYIYVPKLKCV